MKDPSPKTMLNSPEAPFRSSTAIAHLPATTIALSDVVHLLGKMTIPTPTKTEGVTRARKILNILLHRRVSQNTRGELTADFLEETERRIERFMHADEPISLTLVGFHTKIPNFLETWSDMPDLGELSALHFLKQVHESVQAIYPPGLCYNIIAEGYVYGRQLDGLSAQEVRTFYEAVDSLVVSLGAADLFRFIPMDAFCQLREFTTAFSEFLDRLKADRARQSAGSFTPFPACSDFNGDYLSHLNMMYRTVNLCQLGVLAARKCSDFQEVLDQSATTVDMYAKYPSAIWQRAVEMTDWYVAFNAARRQCTNLFCDHVNIGNTIHASFTHKPAKLALRMTGSRLSTFPHHGVPMWIQTSRIHRPSTIVPLCQLTEVVAQRALQAVRPVHVRESEQLFLLIGEPCAIDTYHGTFDQGRCVNPLSCSGGSR